MAQIGYEDKLFYGIISRKVKSGVSKEKLLKLVSSLYDIAERQKSNEVDK